MEWTPDGDDGAAWWLTDERGRATGPVNAAFLLERIRTGAMPAGTLVCAVGGERWQAIGDVPRFVGSLGTPARRFDPTRERSVFDQEALPPDWAERGRARASEPADEVTAVAVPRPASHAPPPLLRVDWSASEPPPEAAFDAPSSTVGVPRRGKSL
jgi:hypothetical protein